MNEIFATDLLEYIKNHEDEFIRSSENMIKHCVELDEKIPCEYSWLFSSKESLDAQLSAVSNGNHKNYNAIYWNDQISNIDAYSMMTLWRGIELVKACLSGLNEKETITPAIAARSLLEISTVFLLNANVLEKTFSNINFPDKTIVTSTEVEELVVKMIWGTRFNNPEPHVQQTNIMTSLKKLAKNPNASELMPTYEFLCDIAHPSFIGNTSYWSHIESMSTESREKRVISRLTTRNTNTDILDKTLWSLAWSSICIRNSFDMLTTATESLANKVNG